jgi:O-antigen ligase
MNGIAQTLYDLYEKAEDRLGKLWPLWALAIFFYAGSSWVLLTRVRLPSPMHLLVYTMAAAIITLTVVKIEWAMLGLAAMIAFTRPGVSFGALNTFHVSGFNFAVLAVWIVYLLRYTIDLEMAAKGPLVRRTPLDLNIGLFLLFVTISTLIGVNTNVNPFRAGDVPVDADPQMRVLLYYKEQLLYFAWFYFVVTLLRTATDLRRFALVFAASGLLVAGVGIYSRFSGTVEAVVATEEQWEAGVVGGRTAGAGFLGLGHPNFFGAFLLMSMPIWFFSVDHLKGFVRRLGANMAVLIGFLGLLFTYSRSSWISTLTGFTILGMADRRALLRIVFFSALFLVVAQGMSLMYAGMSLGEMISIRFEQLNRSGFSERPEIFKSAMGLIKRYPLTGVGPGAFPWHADTSWRSHGFLAQAHNVFLTFGAEMGLPAMLIWIVLALRIFAMSVSNLRAVSRVPGYGFLAQGMFVAMLAISAQMFFVHIFNDRNVGYAYYALVAMVVVMNRLIKEGKLPPSKEPDEYGRVPVPSAVWLES